ncbi:MULTISPECIES: hypothetical protein [unclassified Leifsonia]|uniref:hypothetical protein n=1 Tax=unclassified Leifsonia TaxID=2663824 RepID=UPI0006F7EFEE|nr:MULTISPECIES: hypothetical protein [unclassified Leifsonia]KQX07142.1 hypothetical protein ASC59_04900 [Leifsonia sp. Root1293]KRA11425.1 hypothetical protein ASD61_04900 [Leifsonia sp. Root60]
MTATIEIRSLRPGTALDARVPGLQFTPVRADLWRVVTDRGDVRGHIERVGSGELGRFTARLARAGARSVSLGEFWTAQSAAECFA